jgi:hypothetical protein
MAETAELHARLLAHARNYDPTAHNRSLLQPYRDVLLLWRAKYMSYEQIAAALTQNGLRVSPAAVGVFCRRNFAKQEIERLRRDERDGATRPLSVGPGSNPGRTDVPPARRGPKIARDNY